MPELPHRCPPLAQWFILLGHMTYLRLEQTTHAFHLEMKPWSVSSIRSR